MAFKNAWFHNRDLIQDLPQECIDEMRGPGAKDEAVAYWVKQLNFDGPAWAIRQHLAGYGAWDITQLVNHRDNLERLLWIHASDCAEAGHNIPLYLW